MALEDSPGLLAWLLQHTPNPEVICESQEGGEPAGSRARVGDQGQPDQGE